MSLLSPKPPWLRRRLPASPDYEKVRGLLQNGCLHTVCQEACCPNQWECFSSHTAAFLILGPVCTRNCRFCAVESGRPGPPDFGEPARVAEAADRLGLKYVVVTSVTRDDLPDGGAGAFADTILEIRNRIPGAGIEVLIPDFQGNRNSLETVLNAGPDVLNHNIETVSRLYPLVRPQADYIRSLELLQNAARRFPDMHIKSGIMVGLGETNKEILGVLQDLRAHGCTRVTIGQYLQPTRDHFPVYRYVPPEEFDDWKKTALSLGFAHAACGPFVRSSYHAREGFQKTVTA